MATSVIPSNIQTWIVSSENVTQNGTVIGSVAVWYNQIIKIAIIRWAGNSVKPTAGTLTINLPSGCVPTGTVGNPMRNGDQLEASTSGSTGILRLYLNAESWSNGFVVVPII